MWISEVKPPPFSLGSENKLGLAFFGRLCSLSWLCILNEISMGKNYKRNCRSNFFSWGFVGSPFAARKVKAARSWTMSCTKSYTKIEWGPMGFLVRIGEGDLISDSWVSSGKSSLFHLFRKALRALGNYFQLA